MNKKIITTSRLILRPFVYDDADFMFSNWANNPNVTKYLSWPTHESVEISKMVISNWIKDYENGLFNWAIVLKETNEPIGNISVVKYDKKENTIELGYAIGEDFWNNGYTTEALKAVLNYLYNLGYKKIIAKHDINNPASGKVMKKAGMKFVRIEENSTYNNQGLATCNVYEYVK